MSMEYDGQSNSSYKPTAFFLIKVKFPQEEEMMKELKSMKEIRNVTVVYGSYDVVADTDTPREGLPSLVAKITQSRFYREHDTLIVDQLPTNI